METRISEVLSATMLVANQPPLSLSRNVIAVKELRRCVIASLCITKDSIFRCIMLRAATADIQIVNAQ
jgi:hypothetical protein